MHLIDEKNTRNNLSASLFAPFGNLLIDVLSNFRFDFTNVTSKKSQKSLGSAVNNVNFM
jgi:hypothetical protein